MIQVETGNSVMQRFLQENFNIQYDCDSFVRSFFKRFKESEITLENLETHLNWLNGMYDLDAAYEDD